LGVHLDGAQVRAGGEGEVPRVVGGLRVERGFHPVGQVVRGEHREGDVPEGDGGPRGTRDGERAVGVLEVVLVGLHHV
ncbi:hypothetical protein EX85_15335, partial [Staphylococcus aureus]